LPFLVGWFELLLAFVSVRPPVSSVLLCRCSSLWSSLSSPFREVLLSLEELLLDLLLLDDDPLSLDELLLDPLLLDPLLLEESLLDELLSAVLFLFFVPRDCVRLCLLLVLLSVFFCALAFFLDRLGLLPCCLLLSFFVLFGLLSVCLVCRS
jgi:hypothetical protein